MYLILDTPFATLIYYSQIKKKHPQFVNLYIATPASSIVNSNSWNNILPVSVRPGVEVIVAPSVSSRSIIINI